MLPPVLRDNPERTVPAIRADGETAAVERELRTDILARPEESSPLGEHNAGHALDGTAERRRSEDRDSEADAFVVFFCDHTRDA